MLNLFKRAPKQTEMKILVTSDIILVNNMPLTLPFHYNHLTDVFGPPDIEQKDLTWELAWHESGVFLNYASSDNIRGFSLHLAKSPKSNVRPNTVFKGRVLVEQDGMEVELDLTKGQTVKLGQYEVRVHSRGDEDHISAVTIGKNYDFVPIKDPKKFQHKKPHGQCVEFTDFNFKLCVIQELMYNQDVLTPKFDLHEFVDRYTDRKIDLDVEGYTPIAEVTDWFKALPITRVNAKKVTKIYQDGGNDIYLNMINFWDGEDDLFDIQSAGDARSFPNLKEVVLFGPEDKLIAEFEALGIKACAL